MRRGGARRSSRRPLLIRRIAVEVEPTLEIAIPHPIRVTKGQLLKPGELERAVKFAALNAEVGGGILVILDSDDSCPATSALSSSHE